MKLTKHPMSRDLVVMAGKAVIQETEGGFLIMLPSGKIEFRDSATKAEKLCRKFFKVNCPKNSMSVGTIAWFFTAKSKLVEIIQPT